MVPALCSAELALLLFATLLCHVMLLAPQSAAWQAVALKHHCMVPWQRLLSYAHAVAGSTCPAYVCKW